RTHALEEHGKRLPKIQRVDQPTYSEFLVGKVKRFDEKNTAFSRAVWDEAYQVKVKAAVEKYAAAAAKNTKQQQWDALEGQALVAGAIYVDDSVGVLHPGYGGYMGHMKEVGGLYGWEDPLNETRFPVADPAWMSARIKQVARLYGASLVGITKVNPLWVYSHYFERATGNSGPIDMSYPYAIVIGIEMDWEAINKTPKYEASAATALAYSQMAELSASLAKYIRALGYHALPCGNDTAQSIPLAIDAGLGEIGRNGLLITPEFGPRQRLCKVFTNIPLEPDQSIDFGMRSFCETCHSCASSCPANAIPMGDRSTEPTSISNRTGIQRWTVNVTNCLLFWRENGVDCSNCVAACPWALRSTRDWLET
ncbi:MAG: reductive dehalogenase, partial [Anaerolineales bacterium]|nr:reductive dehalogenase [Anaerolineales bacterium]